MKLAHDDLGKLLLTVSEFRMFKVLSDDLIDFIDRTVIEDVEVFLDVTVGDVHEILVDVVWGGHLRIKIEGTGFGLAEFLAIGIGDELEGEDFGSAVASFLLLDEVQGGRKVAPLVSATELHGAVIFLIEVCKITGLENHVGELGIGNTDFETGFDDVLGKHVADLEVLSIVSQIGQEVGL